MSPPLESAYDRREPCAQCPYRRDAPLAKWHPQHFVDLILADRSLFGAIYLCHNQDGNVCVGWALDQRELRLGDDVDAARQFRELSDGGHPRFASVEEMCLANLRAGMRSEEDEEADDGAEEREGD